MMTTAIGAGRKPHGVRYQLSAVLPLGIMAGCRSFIVIGDWAGQAFEPQPREPTIRRV